MEERLNNKIWERVEKVIESCTTERQLDAAKKYAALAFASVSNKDSYGHLSPSMYAEICYAESLTLVNVKRMLL